MGSLYRFLLQSLTLLWELCVAKGIVDTLPAGVLAYLSISGTNIRFGAVFEGPCEVVSCCGTITNLGPYIVHC